MSSSLTASHISRQSNAACQACKEYNSLYSQHSSSQREVFKSLLSCLSHTQSLQSGTDEECFRCVSSSDTKITAHRCNYRKTPQNNTRPSLSPCLNTYSLYSLLPLPLPRYPSPHIMPDPRPSFQHTTYPQHIRRTYRKIQTTANLRYQAYIYPNTSHQLDQSH